MYTSCLGFRLRSEEPEKTNFGYHYSVYQAEYSRNLLFQVGGRRDQGFPALIDRNLGALGRDPSQDSVGL